MTEQGGRVIACPHCKNDSRVRLEGRYRCPWCKAVFYVSLHGDPLLLEPPPEQPDVSKASEPEHPSTAKEEIRHERLWPTIDVFDGWTHGTQPPISDEPSKTESPHAADDKGTSESLHPASHETSGSIPDGLQICEHCKIRPATRICPTCGAMLCDSCSGPEPAYVSCPICKGGFKASGFAAWREKGIFAAFFSTLRGVLFYPTEFFKSVGGGSTGFLAALIFGIICDTIAGLATLAYNLSFRSFFTGDIFQSLANKIPELQKILDSMIDTSSSYFFLMALLMPVSSVIGIFFYGLVLHLCYLITGNASGKVEASIKIVSYAYASKLFSLVPVIGPIVSSIWGLIVMIYGGWVLHRTTMGKSVVANLLPFLVMCTCAMILIGGALGLLMSLFGTQFAS